MNAKSLYFYTKLVFAASVLLFAGIVVAIFERDLVTFILWTKGGFEALFKNVYKKIFNNHLLKCRFLGYFIANIYNTKTNPCKTLSRS